MVCIRYDPNFMEKSYPTVDKNKKETCKSKNRFCSVLGLLAHPWDKRTRKILLKNFQYGTSYLEVSKTGESMEKKKIIGSSRQCVQGTGYHNSPLPKQCPQLLETGDNQHTKEYISPGRSETVLQTNHHWQTQ